MGFYQYRRELKLKAGIEELWSFISLPSNLSRITPDYMGFEISTDVPDSIYEGLIISYRVRPLAGIKTTWVTEITHVKEGSYFVDEQRVGPYSMWHHQHFLTLTDDGTVMSDIVSYKPPFGFLGSLANYMIISAKLKEIFDYREKVMCDLFGRV